MNLGPNEAVLEYTRNGKYLNIMAGMTKLLVKSNRKITKAVVVDAIYRTIAKNSRLSALVRDFKLVPQADTIGRLKVNLKVSHIEKEMDLPLIENLVEQACNNGIDPLELPWHIHIFIGPAVQQGKDLSTSVYCLVDMSHTICDGMGLFTIVKQFAESIKESLVEKIPLDLNTPICRDHYVFANHISVVPKQANVPIYFYPFVFIWRILQGVLIVLSMIQTMLFSSGNGFFSGTIHDFDHNKPINPNGVRIFDVEPEVVEKLRVLARKSGGSFGSVIQMAAQLAYRSVNEHHGYFQNNLNSIIAVNCRPFVNDYSLITRLNGNATLLLDFPRYPIPENDGFWHHVAVLKKRTNALLYYLSAYMAFLTWNLNSVLGTILTYHTVQCKRNSVLISNIGNFGKEALQINDLVMIEEFFGTASSYWHGNKCLFQVTTATLHGRLRVTLAYAAYMVELKDANRFVNEFTRILRNVANNEAITVREARKVSIAG
jgi:NRPS condensation-like uncharacterized protein